MHRRHVLKCFAGGTVAAFSQPLIFGRDALAQPSPPDLPTEARRELFGSLPYERVEVPGALALERWRELKSSDRGWPVIVGDEQALAALAGNLIARPGRDPEEILAQASSIDHPAQLVALRERERIEAAAANLVLLEGPDEELAGVYETDEEGNRRRLTPDEVRARIRADATAPYVGPWPERAGFSDVYPTVAFDPEEKPFGKVHILLIPAATGADVPAYLNWGGFGRCPAPEIQVAALRAWSVQSGAELVGLNADTMNVLASRRPVDREAAIRLAREQMLLCPDSSVGKDGNLSPLAAMLMNTDWWDFWWDHRYGDDARSGTE